MNFSLFKVLKKIFLLLFCILIYSTSYAQVPKDVTKQSAAATKAAADAQKALIEDAEKIKKSLAFKVADFFKFKSNVRKNQQKRILDIVESLGIQDSINVSGDNIKILIEALSKVENQHFDTLLSLINGLKVKPDGTIVVESPDKSLNSSNQPVTDSEIDELTNKMLPLVAKEVSQPVDSKDKREKIAELRKTAQQLGTIHTDTINGVLTRYTLITNNKVKVLGFLNYNKQPEDDYNYDNYDNIIYNGLFVDGKTGNFKNLNGWDNSPTLSSLSQSGISPIVNVIFSNKEDFSSILLNKNNQNLFFQNTLYVMNLHNTNGVCLQIDQPDPLLKNEITEFIQAFSEKIKAADKDYQIYLIIPNAKINAPFDLSKFDEFIDFYILNFYNPSESTIPGPIASIRGKDLSSIESTLSYYTNMNVLPSKFILGLGYQGSRWAYSAAARNFKFSQQLTYSEIRRTYLWPVIYDDENGTATMDSVNIKGALVRRIYLEDENTLGKKYDFVLENGLGGVALYSLGFDEGFGELNDMLMYKLSRVDTLHLKDSIISGKDLSKIGFFKKLGIKYKLYQYILNFPCEICFENIEDPALRSEIEICIRQLGYDTLALQQQTTTFKIANDSLKTVITIFLFLTLFISLLLGYLLYLRIKNKGDEVSGKNQKILPLFTLIFSFFTVILFLLWLFTSDVIPWFGMSSQNDADTKDTKSSKDSVGTPKKDKTLGSIYQQVNREKRKIQTAGSRIKNLPRTAQRLIRRKLLYGSKSNQNEEEDSSNLTSADSLKIQASIRCIKAKNDTCYNVPFQTLFYIIIGGIVFGILMGFLIMKNLFNKVDIP
jgi:spore germination protein YaaH